MTRTSLFIALLLLVSVALYAQPPGYGEPYRTQVAPTRNVILMIPDGTSIGVLSAARWYNFYNGAGDRLAVDEYICGAVRSFASNSPIADSAPGGSAYLTGFPPRTKNLSIYPEADPGNDLFPVDPAMAYRPLATLMEAARIDKGKATGIVVKVEFPHATPASCAAHTSRRDAYDVIAMQMAHQDIDVLMGGGVGLLTPLIENYLASRDTKLYTNDIEGFRAHRRGPMWSLWCEREFPYVLDHDASQVPLLAEMTGKALEILSQNEEGFFLMVEGSMVDWAGHSNDAVGLITEFIEFDEAVKVVMDFARRDGNTTVVIVPDHGNSGFTLGNYRLEKYDATSLDQHYAAISKFRKTATGLQKLLMEADTADYVRLFFDNTGIELSGEEVARLKHLRGVEAGDYMSVGYSENMTKYIVDITNARHYFGYVSSGHSGEDVFLAAYHPAGNLPLGVNTNTEINNYLADALGLERRLPELSAALFVPHDEALAGYGLEIKFDEGLDGKKHPELTIKRGRSRAVILPDRSVANVDGRQVALGSVAVYMPETGKFYLPGDTGRKLFGE